MSKKDALSYEIAILMQNRDILLQNRKILLEEAKRLVNDLNSAFEERNKLTKSHVDLRKSIHESETDLDEILEQKRLLFLEVHKLENRIKKPNIFSMVTLILKNKRNEKYGK